MFLLGALSVGAAPAVATAAENCPAPLTADGASRLQMDGSHFLSTLDRATYDRPTTPDFVVYENGKANSRDQKFAHFQQLIEAGNYAKWSVTEPHLQADCNVAVLNYRNIGKAKIGDVPPVSKQWWEVVVFHREGNGCKLSFQCSMRDAAIASHAAVAP